MSLPILALRRYTSILCKGRFIQGMGNILIMA